MPIAVEVNGASWFEDSMTLAELRFHPSRVVLDSTFLSVLERADFVSVTPDDFVVLVRKERWVRVDQVNRVFWEP